MQIVINIDDDLYKSIIGHRYKIKYQQFCDYEDLKNAIEDGAPLSRGHGRLIDVDEVIKIADKTKDLHGAIWNVPTIVEADRSEEDG